MTKTKRKKLKNMSRTELIAYAKGCPGFVLKPKMTKPQIINAIPWKFRDHDGGDVPEAPEAPKTEAERLADLEAREEAVKEAEEKLAGQKNVIQEPIEQPLGVTPILDAVKVKANTELRRYVSMEGHLRYGLTDEQKERAAEVIKKVGCTQPIKREKKEVKSGF